MQNDALSHELQQQSETPLLLRIQYASVCAFLGSGVGVLQPLLWFLVMGRSIDWGLVIAFVLGKFGFIGGGIIGFLAGAFVPRRAGIALTFALQGVALLVAACMLLINMNELAPLALVGSVVPLCLAWAIGRRSPRTITPARDD